jgi:hypothetical protein
VADFRFREAVIQTWPHHRYGWVMVPIRVSGKVRLSIALNPGVIRLCITTDAREALLHEELLPPVAQRRFVLADAESQGQRLPPLHVRVSRFRYGDIDGLLGLDFLQQLTDIHVHVPTFRRTLSIA